MALYTIYAYIVYHIGGRRLSLNALFMAKINDEIFNRIPYQNDYVRYSCNKFDNLVSSPATQPGEQKLTVAVSRHNGGPFKGSP